MRSSAAVWLVLGLAGGSAALLGCSSDEPGSPATTGDAAPAGCVQGGPCASEGSPCDGVETCRSCGFESWVREAPRCLCKAGAWACTLTECGPFTPNTFVDAECKTRRDAGTVDTGGTDTGVGDTGGPGDAGDTGDAGGADAPTDVTDAPAESG